MYRKIMLIFQMFPFQVMEDFKLLIGDDRYNALGVNLENALRSVRKHCKSESKREATVSIKSATLPTLCH